MNKAAFRLDTYVFDKFSFDLGSVEDSSSMNIDINPEGSFACESGVYNLLFDVSVTNKDTNTSIITLHCSAKFTFNDIHGLEDIPEYFYTNSIAILFPYIRAMISTLSLQANSVSIVLPTMNLSHLAPILKEHTTSI